jgi:hypothetical protein
MPGRVLPSSSSRLAPPPVEMWLIFSATPTFSTAATESPPPMMVQHALVGEFRQGVGNGLVPAANLSNSNTPMGPFQITLLHCFRASWNTFTSRGRCRSPSSHREWRRCHGLAVGVGGKVISHHHIGGQQQFHAFLLGLGFQSLGQFQLVFFHQSSCPRSGHGLCRR